ncbi:hypothetical protein Cgig2_030907 [Carnegiea gigantea]|uniref:Uncharacterized protein n=1 Tax=Carnegiea gigantea TaxID=171969 RepID=A0A9Q1KI87_9CARY|nr:hypothetical protein Cgig2_030907 [Carnegiea gigantea]
MQTLAKHTKSDRTEDRTRPAWTGPRLFGPIIGPFLSRFRSSVRSSPGPGGLARGPDRSVLGARWPAAAAVRRFPSRLLLPCLLAALLDRLLLAFFSLSRAHLLSSAALLLLNPDLLSVFVQLVEVSFSFMLGFVDCVRVDCEFVNCDIVLEIWSSMAIWLPDYELPICQSGLHKRPGLNTVMYGPPGYVERRKSI